MGSLLHPGLQHAARIPGMRALVYVAEALRFRGRHGGPLRWPALAAEYGRWRDDQRRHVQPLARGIPWLTFGAIEFLEQRLRPDMRVFEYGSGDSTIFFASRVAAVFSVEHDPAWSRHVTDALAARGLTTATTLLVEPSPGGDAAAGDPADPDAYTSSDAGCAGRNFRAYAAAIDSHADGEFDVILIDGRARPSCLKHALPKLRPGGLLVLDNAERPSYSYIHNRLDALGWPRYDFSGAGPASRHFWKTAAWDRPLSG